MFIHHVAWLYIYKIREVVLFSAFFILFLYLTCVRCGMPFNVLPEAVWKCFPELHYFPLIKFSSLLFLVWQISELLSQIPYIYPMYICIHIYIICIQYICKKCTYIVHIMYVFIALGLESLQYFEPICHPICPYKLNKITCLHFVVSSVFRLSLRIQYSALSNPEFCKSKSRFSFWSPVSKSHELQGKACLQLNLNKYFKF